MTEYLEEHGEKVMYLHLYPCLWQGNGQNAVGSAALILEWVLGISSFCIKSTCQLPSRIIIICPFILQNKSGKGWMLSPVHPEELHIRTQQSCHA